MTFSGSGSAVAPLTAWAAVGDGHVWWELLLRIFRAPISPLTPTFLCLVPTLQIWPSRMTTAVIGGGAHRPIPQTETVTDGDVTPATTTTEARDDEMMTAEALSEKAHVAGPLAAHLGGTVLEETMTDIDEKAENDLQVPQMRTAEDGDTAAIDTARTVIVMVTSHQGDIGVHGHGLVPRDPHVVHRHCNEGDRFLHNPTHSRTR